MSVRDDGLAPRPRPQGVADGAGVEGCPVQGVRPPLYSEAVIEALWFGWAVQGTPCGRLLAAALPDLVPRLRRVQGA
jgi:hypothetical protein